MLMKVEVENYMNNYEQGGMQLDPHPHKDNINTPAYQAGNSNFQLQERINFQQQEKKQVLAWNGFMLQLMLVLLI